MAVKRNGRFGSRSRLVSIRRTRQLVANQIDAVNRAAEPGSDASTADSVKAVTALVRLLESLNRLERCHRNECAQRAMERKERLNDQELRDMLAQRIDALCGRRHAEAGS